MAEVTLLKRKKKIGEIAVELGFVTEAQVDNILSQKGITGRMLGQLFVDEGLLDDEQLAQIIAAQYSCRYASFESLEDIEVLKLLDIDFMVKKRVVPFLLSGDVLDVAVADPMDFFRAVEAMEIRLDHDLSFIIVSKKKLTDFLQRLDTSRDLLDISDEMRLPVVRESEKANTSFPLKRWEQKRVPSSNWWIRPSLMPLTKRQVIFILKVLPKA